jgi:hypothetical protein
VKPEEELMTLLPPAPPERRLPRQSVHRSNLLAAVGAEAPGPRGIRWTRVRRRPAAGRWLVPAGAAAAVIAVVLAAVALTGPTAHDHAGGAVRPSGQPTAAPDHVGAVPVLPTWSGRLAGPRHWQLSSAGLHRVVLRTNTGSITVTGEPSGSPVAITARPSYRGAAPVVSSNDTGGVLTVSALCPNSTGRRSSCTVALQVSLPRSVPVRASTDVGSVGVTNVAGSVAVTDQVGDINAHGLASNSVTLSAQVGSIDVAFSAPPGRVDATDQAGSVAITVPASVSYRVDASDQLGLMKVTVPQAANSAHVIIASTQVGGVSVTG